MDKTTLGFDKIYVINLKKRKDRKESLLKKLNFLDLTFIEAVDGEKCDLNLLIEQKKVNRSFFDPSGMVTKGIFACGLSHKKCWDKMIEDEVNTALILEDDVFINKNQFEYYNNILEEINSLDWDLIHLGKKSLEVNGINVGNFLTVPRYNSNHNGAHAYAITNNFANKLSKNYLPIKYAADVYLEQFYLTDNLFTLKTSLFMQDSDLMDPHNQDSDTYYNNFKDDPNGTGLNFDNDGNVINKKIVKYLKHPDDLLDQYTECILDVPKFGNTLFNIKDKELIFSYFELLTFLKRNSVEGNMIEINCNLGESSFFFATSNLFDKLYCFDDFEREYEFNIKNNLSRKDVEVGFKSNNYFFKKKVNLIKDNVKNVDKLKNINFIFIHNIYNEKITDIFDSIKKYNLKNIFIAGNNVNDLKNIKYKERKVFNDRLWLVKV